jgi:hypothetical protein
VPYELTWYATGDVLRLDLQKGLSQDELRIINQAIVDILNESTRNITLLIDVSEMTAGYGTVNHLRETQRYPDHPRLDAIIVIANNKLNRLITLLAFNLVRAQYIQFDNLETARRYMVRKGFFETSSVRENGTVG